MRQRHRLPTYTHNYGLIERELMQASEVARLPRDEALAQARTAAIEAAVEAGAIRDTVEIIDAEDVPLQYYPGHTNRVKVKAAGDLA